MNNDNSIEIIYILKKYNNEVILLWKPLHIFLYIYIYICSPNLSTETEESDVHFFSYSALSIWNFTMEDHNIVDISKIYVFYIDKLVEENKAV